METLISSMISSGRSENRPPHILLLMIPCSRLACRHRLFAGCGLPY
jgi:hypothetical protein